MSDILTSYNEVFRIGLESLLLHKARSVLTMLGIIFGVGAVIAMLSIGEGARQETLEQIEVLGVRNVIVRSVVAEESDDETEKKTRPMGISLRDADAILDICPFVDHISVSRENAVTARTYEGSTEATLVGTSPSYRSIFNVRIEEGNFLLPHHLKSTANVCVIGSEVKKELFGFKNPVGSLVKLDDQWFTVIGVAGEKKAASATDVKMPDANATIHIPITTAMAKFPREIKAGGRFFFRRFGIETRGGGRYQDRSIIDQISVQIQSGIAITEAARVLSRILEIRHNRQMDFTVTIPEQLIEQSQKTQRIFNIVMGAIAGISLLVGGIGIMNIMLASVLERTREIGVRRAIGATRNMVILQFLAEATMLAVVGGIGGIGLGWGLTGLITVYAGWRTIVSGWSIALAFSVAALTGILFGFYPARRAAYADIIDALRYE